MFYFPMAFMYIATISALVITVKNNIMKLTAGTGTIGAEGLQVLFSVLLIILAINLAIVGTKTLRNKKTLPPDEVEAVK